MSGTLELSGYENLTEQTTDAGLHIERLAARTPAPVWAVRCIRCNATFTLPHSKVRYAGCKSSNCGAEGRVRNHASVSNPQVAVRSRDAASLREFQRSETQETNAPVKWGVEPSPEWFAKASHEQVRSYLAQRDGY